MGGEDETPQTECPAKLARWLALHFGLFGLDKELRSKSQHAVFAAKQTLEAVKDQKEFETLRRYVLRLKALDTNGLQKGDNTMLL